MIECSYDTGVNDINHTFLSVWCLKKEANFFLIVTFTVITIILEIMVKLSPCHPPLQDDDLSGKSKIFINIPM